MDQDGANTKYLTLGNELVLTPDLILQIKWSLIFLILEICPSIFIDIETGNARSSWKFSRHDICT